MDNEIAVGDINGRTDRAEQLESLPKAQGIRGAILVNRHTLNVFHHEVRNTVLGGTAVQQACDVRVFERGENLPFVPERSETFGGSGVVRNLQRNDLAVFLVRTFREEYPSHAAAADLLDDAVGTESAADPWRGCACPLFDEVDGRSSREHGSFKQRRRADGGKQERADFLLERLVTGTGVNDKTGSSRLRLLERRRGNRFDANPIFASHPLNRTRERGVIRLSES
jgi:hypothetical protein